MDQATVIRRVEALMAQAASTPFAAEAETFTAKAQELIETYNISVATLEASGKKVGTEGERVKDETSKNFAYKWQFSLMVALCKANAVTPIAQYRISKKYRRVHCGWKLYGRMSSVMTVRVMYQYLVSAVFGLRPVMDLSRESTSFMQGCGDRIAERVLERWAEAQEKQAKEAEKEETRRREAAATARHPAAAPADPTFHAPVVYMCDWYSTEADLNNDLRMGWEPGTTAQRKMEHEARWARDKADREEREAREKARREKLPPKERRRLEREEAKEQARTDAWWRRQQRKQDTKERNEWRNRDSSAYYDGRDKGEEVGLDTQIDEDRKRRLT